jgi:hypothetical protein
MKTSSERAFELRDEQLEYLFNKLLSDHKFWENLIIKHQLHKISPFELKKKRPKEFSTMEAWFWNTLTQIYIDENF